MTRFRNNLWSGRGVEFSFCCFLIMTLALPFAEAQTPTVEYLPGYDNTKIPSSTSILTKQTTDGRFGPMSSGGFIQPAPGENSRFNSSAVYSSAGAYIGTAGSSPNSRFQRWWDEPEFQSQGIDFSLYRDYFAARREAARPTSGPAPVQATATPPTASRDTDGGNLSYFTSGQYFRDRGTPQTGWESTIAGFRDAASPSAGPLRQERNNSASGSAAFIPPPMTEVDLGSRFGGDIHDNKANDLGSDFIGFLGNRNSDNRNNIPADFIAAPGSGAASPANVPERDPNFPPENVPVPSPEELAKMELSQLAAFEEHLELLLLQSPLVHPLSPIKVEFRDGTATVRGIVPKQENRIEAGKILLTDPRVNRVDNKLSVMPEEQ